MSVKRIAITLAIILVSSSTVFAAAEKEALQRADAPITLPEPPTVQRSTVERPVILPALYATLGGMQAWDIYTTTRALTVGAHEANPTAATFSSHAGSLVGLKAATTVGTIFFAERMWKKNKVGAIVMLVAVNGATAAVSMHNMRNARSGRR
jgi:hypothetical protein